MNDTILNRHAPWIADAVEQVLKLCENRKTFTFDDVDAYLDVDPPFADGIKAAVAQACQRGICAETDKPGVFLSQRLKEGI